MSDPKIEPWMVAAAKEVIEAEGDGHLFRTIRNEMEATEGRRAGTDRDATQRTYEALAAIIARHAPDPASVPIGPGDVVQVVSETAARSWLGIVREKYDNGKWFVIGYGCADAHELARIGKAEYWPDGSKVEEGE
jgi:hypothetical protein